jgi:hypothetical protein
MSGARRAEISQNDPAAMLGYFRERNWPELKKIVSDERSENALKILAISIFETDSSSPEKAENFKLNWLKIELVGAVNSFLNLIGFGILDFYHASLFAKNVLKFADADKRIQDFVCENKIVLSREIDDPRLEPSEIDKLYEVFPRLKVTESDILADIAKRKNIEAVKDKAGDYLVKLFKLEDVRCHFKQNYRFGFILEFSPSQSQETRTRMQNYLKTLGLTADCMNQGVLIQNSMDSIFIKLETAYKAISAQALLSSPPPVISHQQSAIKIQSLFRGHLQRKKNSEKENEASCAPTDAYEIRSMIF